MEKTEPLTTKIMKSLPSVLTVIVVNVCIPMLSSTISVGAEPQSSNHGRSVSRNEFESRFGKPLCTEAEFGKKFSSIYGVEFKDFLATPQPLAKQMIKLSGLKADGLSEGSYYVVIPRVFVDFVPTNTLASEIGLQPGDELMEAYWETASFGVGYQDALSEGGHENGWKPSGDNNRRCRVKLSVAQLSLWRMNLPDIVHDDRNGLRLYAQDWFDITRGFGRGTASESVMLERYGKDCFKDSPSDFKGVDFSGPLKQTKQKLRDLLEKNPTGIRIKTQRGVLSLPLRRIERYVSELPSQTAPPPLLADDDLIAAVLCAAMDERLEQLYKELGFSDRNSARNAGVSLYNPAAGFVGKHGAWLPEYKSLGAKCRTVYEIKAGLSKEQQRQTIEDLTFQKSRVQGDRTTLEDALVGTELFEGFSFGFLHNGIQNVAENGESAFAGGLLTQLRNVKRLRPEADFCIYRGDGIDALAFFEKDALLFCIEYTMKNSFLLPAMPRDISSRSLIECAIQFEKGQQTNGDRASESKGVGFIPRDQKFCPVFNGNTLFYRSAGEQQTWKSVNLLELENAATLVQLEYRKIFTNTFALMNQQPPLLTQNHRLLRKDEFNALEGAVSLKWQGNTNLPDVVLSWPLSGVAKDVEGDKNLFYVGQNYSGQLVLPASGGYAMLFGKSEFLVPELLEITSKKVRSEAGERAYWDRYIQITTGKSGAANRLSPEQRIENARRLLDYLNTGR